MGPIYPAGKEKSVMIEEYLKVDRNTCDKEAKREQRQLLKKELRDMIHYVHIQILQKSALSVMIDENYEYIWLNNDRLLDHYIVFLRLYGITAIETRATHLTYMVSKCKFDPARYKSRASKRRIKE